MPVRGQTIMYVRFALTVRHPLSRVPAGIFYAAYDVCRDEQMPDYLRSELRPLLDWFNDYLAVPTRFAVRSKKRWQRVGICWFRGEAADYVARGREVARLLNEADVPTSVLKTRQPGQILYRDAHQIVAKPRPETPVAW